MAKHGNHETQPREAFGALLDYTALVADESGFLWESERDGWSTSTTTTWTAGWSHA